MENPLDVQLLRGVRKTWEQRGDSLAPYSWPLCHLLLPSDVSPDLCSGFAVKTLHIVMDVFIVRIPRAKMTNQEVMISAPRFTQRDQVVWVKFQMRMKMEGFDMMDLQLLPL